MSHRAYYWHKRFNWKEINNLFCYDVKIPERLSKKQQILRLYKNSCKRIWETEWLDFKGCDVHSLAYKRRQIREEFDKLKDAKDISEVDKTLEKWEFFIEYNFNLNPFTSDNVAYEWKHSKGLMVFDKQLIESDQWGYYDKKLLDYYAKPKEYQYIDDYPFEDSLMTLPAFQPNEWDMVDENYRINNSSNAKTPEEFEKEIEELNRKFNNPQSDNIYEEGKKL